jgi:heme a synthase
VTDDTTTIEATLPSTERDSGARVLSSQARFARFAWGLLAYTLFVILFGAVVRITGSGAGCGQNWPTCHGEIAHLPRSADAAIELTHRLTSGLSGILTLLLVGLAWKRFEPGHAVRRAAFAALVFMVAEALFGALLVRRALVGTNDSVERAIVLSIHLVNTSMLSAAMALAAWHAGQRATLRWRLRSRDAWLALLGVVATLVVSITGAVTALGDTLYPVSAAADLPTRLATDHGLTAHFLQRMRALHPLVAVGAAAYLFYLAPELGRRGDPNTRLLSRALIGLVLAQVAAGLLSIWLSAPGYMQVLHLALATLLWIVLILLSASALTEPERVTERAAAP